MKEYPSIPRMGRTSPQIDMYTFSKEDGSNIRSEWIKKNGWYKFGSRTRLLDETDELLGGAKTLFMETWSEPLTKIAVDQRWEQVIVFFEYWGENSFAGTHVPEEPKNATLFDVAPYKKGILGPKEFLKLFGHFDNIPRYLGVKKWTPGFVEQVRLGQIEGASFEGVIGKAGEGHNQVRAKAKTQAWIDKVRALYAPELAEKLVNS